MEYISSWNLVQTDVHDLDENTYEAAKIAKISS